MIIYLVMLPMIEMLVPMKTLMPLIDISTYDFTGRAREEGQRYKEESSCSRKRMRKKKLIPRIIMPR